MRPRVFPAEDAAQVLTADPVVQGFNEAAGIPRGRRRPERQQVRVRHASMRPRVFPAEDGLTYDEAFTEYGLQ